MKYSSAFFSRLILVIVLSVFALGSCRSVSESENDKASVTAATPGPYSTHRSEPDVALSTPRLVVGIVVDQMRYEFLTRYMDRFGEGGFSPEATASTTRNSTMSPRKPARATLPYTRERRLLYTES